MNQVRSVGNLFADSALPLGAGLDNRRSHVRAYEQWVSKLRGRAWPSLKDMEPESLDAPYSLLLDLRESRTDPTIVKLGRALRAEAESRKVERLSDLPSDSLLRQLTSHCPIVLESGEPIAFEGEHQGPASSVMYRGMLLPFGGSAASVEFIQGIINWREIADSAITADIAFQVGQAFRNITPANQQPLWKLYQSRQPDFAAQAQLPLQP